MKISLLFNLLSRSDRFMRLTKGHRSSVVFIFLLFLPFLAQAQFPYDETFRGATASGVHYGGVAKLTAGNPNPIDAVGQGYLRLTPAEGNKTGYVYGDDVFLGTYGLKIEFEYFTWGGNGADGIAFFLFDASVTDAQFNIGGFGGSLGYAQLNGAKGVSKGYLGIGLDEWGNFAHKDEGRQGGLNQTTPNSITIRGAGNGSAETANNYPWINTISPSFTVAGGQRADTVRGMPGYRKVFIDLKPVAGKPGLLLNMSVISGSDSTHIITDYQYTTPVPAAGLKYGISSSTGGNNNNHEIRGLHIQVDPKALAPIVAVPDTGTICQGQTIMMPILANDKDPNDKNRLDETVDLDVNTDGYQDEFTNANGKYTFNKATKMLTFVPVATLTEPATLYYYFKDYYGGVSNQALITINTKLPKITKQPAFMPVCEGASATSSATVEGTVTYQWEYFNTATNAWENVNDGNGVSGSQTATISLANAPISLNGVRYRLKVTSTTGGCIVYSVENTLTVYPKAVVTKPADQSLCNNINTAAVTFAGGSSGTVYNWTRTGADIGMATSSGTGTINSFKAVNTTTAPIVATITVTPNTALGCPGDPQSFTITVKPDVTIALTSAVSTTTQEVCIGTPITTITYTIGNATGATVTGLPAGVGGTYDAATGIFTISGSPTVAGGPLTYTVTPTGGCTAPTLGGTIKVNPNVTLVLTSAPSSTTQTILIGTPITNIVYKVTNGTGATVTGLPNGVTGNYDAATGNFTISGTPTQSGPFTYTVTTIAVCSSQSLTGTFQVDAPAIRLEKIGVLSADGKSINYTFKVINNGDVTLKDLVLNDPRLGGGVTLGPPGNLAAGNFVTGGGSYPLTLADRDAGSVTNTATVTAASLTDFPVTSTATVVTSIPETPLISLVKKGVLSADKSTITYTFTVKNIGDVTLHGLTLTDTKLVGPLTLAKTTLAPQEITTGTFVYTVTLADRDAGNVNNTATVNGLSPKDVPVSDVSGTAENNNDNTVTPIIEAPAINLLKVGVLSADKSTITYTFTVKNIGDVTLHGLSLADTKLVGPFTFLNYTLAPQESTTGSFVYTVTLADRDAGQVDNTATVTGLSPKDAPVTDVSGTAENNNDHTVTPIIEAPAINLVKKGVLSADKSTITYTFTVKNIGDVTLHALSLVDTKLVGPFTFLKNTLEPQESTTGSFVYTVTLADRDAGNVENTATVTGLSPKNAPVSDVSGTAENNNDQTVTPIIEAPAINLVKVGLLSADKSSITYTFTVKNIGDVTLHGLSLADTKLVGPFAFAKNSLEPQETTTGTFVYTVTLADRDAGQVDNTATVTGLSPKNAPVTDVSGTAENNNDHTVTPIIEAPAINLVKVGVLSADKSTITYTFTVKNIGDVTLHGLSLADTKLVGPFTFLKNTLEPQESTTGSFVYTVTLADRDAGEVNNTATVSGLSPKDAPVTDVSGTAANNDDHTVTPIVEAPAINLVKVGVLSADKATITYTFTIKNIGDVTLHGFTLADTKLVGPVTFLKNTLEPQETTTGTFVYTVTLADRDAGKVQNTATVTGLSPKDAPVTDVSGTAANNDDQTVTPIIEAPAINLVKVGVLSADKSTITYTFTIKNIGDVTLHGFTLADAKLVGPVTFLKNTLEPQESTTGTFVYTVTLADRDAGKVENTATVTGLSPKNAPVTDVSGTAANNDDQTVTPIIEAPAINLVKVGVLSADKSTITYTFTIKNIGDVTLHGFTLADTKLVGPVTFLKNTLQPQETTTGTFVYTVTLADRDAGKVENTATVTGLSPKDAPVTDVSGTAENNDNQTVTPIIEAPAINLIKVGVLSADKSTITYTFTVKNIGDVTLHGLSLVDTKLVGPFTFAKNSLEPQEITTGTFVYTVTLADRDAGEVNNTATVTGLSPKNAPVSDVSGTAENNDDHTVTPIIEAPAINLVKVGVLSADKSSITYTFRVKNIGDVTLHGITLTDPKLVGPLTLIKTTLEPQETTTGSFTYLVTLADRDAGQVENTATVNGLSPKDAPVTDVSGTAENNDDHTVTPIIEAPAINLVKVGVLSADKSTITYTFTIKNIGDVTLHGFTLADTKLVGPVTFLKNTLEPQETTTGTFVYTVTLADRDAGKVENTATVTGLSPKNAPVTDVSGTAANNDDQTVTPIIEAPAINLVKVGVLSADKSTITYTFTIKNIGDVTLHGFTLADTKLVGPVTFLKNTLEPQETTTGTFVYPVTLADRDAGKVENTATVTGLSPKDAPVTDVSGTAENNDDQTVTPIIEAPAINLVKVGILSADKSTITYTFTIKNIGDVTLHGFTLADTKLVGPVTFLKNTLQPQESTTGTFVYTVTLADRDAGKVENTATVTGLSPKDAPVTDVSGTAENNDDQTVTPIIEAPAINLVKVGVLSADKSTITYTFTVKNIGDVTLHGLSLVDTKLVGPFTFVKNTLEPQESTTGSFVYTVTLADRDAGEVNNTATVTGLSPKNAPVSDVSGTAENNDDHTITPIIEAPAINLVKVGILSADKSSITYTFTVKNIGDVTLHGLSLVDTKLVGPFTFAKNSLEPQETTTGTFTYLVTLADRDAGQVDNTATVTGLSPKNAPVTDVSGTAENNDDHTVTPIVEAPAINLVKAGVLSADKSTITYTFTIKNIGDVTLHNFTLADTKLVGPVTFLKNTLAPQESTTGTFTYLVTLADRDAGKVDNTATVTGLSPKDAPVTDVSGTATNNDDHTVTPIIEAPAINLVKVGVLSADKATITYTFTIKNIGDVTLHGFTLADTKLVGPVTFLKNTLEPQETTTGTFVYTVTLADRDAGKVENTATVTGLSPKDAPVTDVSGTAENNDDQTVTPIIEAPAINLVKVGVLSVDKSTITYTFTIKNIGDVTLHGFTLADTKLVGPVTFLKNTLQPQESTTGTFVYTVTLADRDAGKVENTATVTGLSPKDAPVTDVSGTAENNDDQTVTPIIEAPEIKLIKEGVLSADKSTITYKFTVTNTGDVTLHGLSLVDEKLTAVVTFDKTSLKPGESTIGNFTYVVTLADRDAGQVDNTAKITGLSPKDAPVTDVSGTALNNDDHTVTPILEAPAINLVKAGVLNADKSTITYTFTIKNIGDVTLHGFTLADTKLVGPVTFLKNTLAPQESTTGTFTYLVTLADRDAGKVENTATVTGLSPKDAPVTDVSGTAENNDDQTVTPIIEAPAIKLVKEGVLSADKSTITYKFTVTNTGDVTLHGLTLVDEKLTAVVTFDKTSLKPGESTIGNFSYIVTLADRDGGQVDNTAKITGLSPKDAPVTDVSGTALNNDDHTVTAILEAPAIKLIKEGVLSADKSTITYKFTVTNTGDVTLHGLSLADEKLTAVVTFDKTSLKPGESTIGNFTYIVTLADRDAGQVDNTAKITGLSPKDAPVTDVSGTALNNDDHTVTPILEAPAIKLIKEGVLSADKSTITYKFTVTNTGDVTLHGFTLADEKLVGTVTFDKTSLKPGESTIGNFSYLVSLADRNAGNVTNTAKITGLSPRGAEVTDISGTGLNNDDATVTPIPEAPAIKLVKKGSLSVDKNTILYTFEITNTGDVTLKNLVLTDDKLPGALTIPGVETLAPGVTKTVTATYTINQLEKDAQLVTNTAEVKAVSPADRNVNDKSGTAQNNDEDTQVIVPESPAITLVKTGVISTDKTKITYKFKITNTGNVTLKNFTLTDAKIPGVLTIDPIRSLAPGAELELTAVYTITQDEIDAGKVTNTATVTGKSPADHTVTDRSGTEQNNNIDTEVIVPQTTAVTLTKITTGTIPSILDGILTYELKVTNTGTVTLYNLVVTDPNATVTGGSPIAKLAPNASVIVTATHKLTQADIDGGKVINQATVKGTNPNGDHIDKPSDDPNSSVPNDPTVTPITRSGAIALVKTGAVNSSSSAVVFTFKVTNTGNVTLKNIVLSDPMLGGVISLNTTTLAPGQSTTVTKSYTLTLADRNAGKITNTATVNGVTPQGGTVTDVSGTDLLNDTPTTVIVIPEPAINLVKTGNLSRDFSTITYYFLITNTGNVTLNDLNLVDVKITGNIVLNKTRLEPGEVATASVVYTVTDQEKRDGIVINTATATGKSPAGGDVTAVSGTKDNNTDPTTHVIDDAPQAINDNTSTIINQPVTFTLTENDLPSFNGLDKGSIVIIKYPENGQVSVHLDGTVTYTPNRGYSGPDGFTYTITDLKGKVSNKALVSITVIPIDLFIPNTFTPNGDGKNDTFKIIGRESYDTIELLVFNRWGNEVYRNKNYLDEWEGSGLSEGTYYYILTLKKGANQVSKKGWILLKR